MVATIAARLPGRRIHVVADAAYHGKQVRSLPEQVTWTTRLPFSRHIRSAWARYAILEMLACVA